MAESIPEEKHLSDTSFSMKVVIKGLKTKWPNVKNVNTAVFNQWLKPKNEEESIAISNQPKNLIILDARPEEEYVVSHLKTSRRVDPEAKDVKETLEYIQQSKVSDEPATIVCYCSIGYRSSLYANALSQNLDDKDQKEKIEIYNLEGSLFKWANERRPMVDSNDRPTEYAHPYNFIWGKLLSKELRKDKVEQ